MTTYTIYLDRIEMAFDGRVSGTASLDYILTSLSSDLYLEFLSSAYGKGYSYRSLSLLIDHLAYLLESNDIDNVASVLGVLRYSLSFLRRFKFSDFQINILNHD